MPIERNNADSITIRDNNSVTAIGRISGASDDKREEKFRQWVEDCAKQVKVCTHTFKETKQYFLEHCDTLPLPPDDRRMKYFKLNVIMNYFKDKLEHQASEFSFDMTDEEIEKWHKEEAAVREEALSSPPERFCLKLRGYCLPHTERNEAYYEETRKDWETHSKLSPAEAEQVRHADICFYFEETTGYIQSSGAGTLIRELTIYRGISKEDIEKRTPRFLGYITALREIGELPDFKKE
ncbi:MAG: hypothetical protein K0R84_1902 [Clostridia bacterium]|jgi:hypothetical protein|nr:hypothetical protein [Clostridia bacterium]